MLNNNVNFSNLDTINKLNFLESLVVSKLVNQENTLASSEKDFNTKLKLLLEIIKFQHNITDSQQKINFIDLFNKVSNTR